MCGLYKREDLYEYDLVWFQTRLSPYDKPLDGLAQIPSENY